MTRAATSADPSAGGLFAALALLGIALDRLEHWTSKGAKPTDTVARLARKCRAQPAAAAA